MMMHRHFEEHKPGNNMTRLSDVTPDPTGRENEPDEVSNDEDSGNVPGGGADNNGTSRRGRPRRD